MTLIEDFLVRHTTIQPGSAARFGVDTRRMVKQKRTR